MSAPAHASDSGFGRKESNRIRARFLTLRDRRLERIKASLQREQRQFLELLPLLFHVNHPLLPGFVNTDTPAGVADYGPTRHELLLARRHARSVAAPRRAFNRYPVRALYLMGSLGTLGQEASSDFDIWLCYGAELDAEQRAGLSAKAARIEAWGASLGVKVCIFPMQAEAFRDGHTLPLSDESSGGLGRHLLLEEFYRTGVLLAGLPPLWWLVPPDKEHEYAGFTRWLCDRRFVSPQAWLDFGGLDEVPAEAFFEAAHWQLHKSIASPYKALLKLMLFETYAADYPDVRWVSQRIKTAVYATDQPDPDELDPYRLVLERITEHLVNQDETERLELARRAFYVKAGQALSRRIYRSDWKREQMSTLVRSWGWSRASLQHMDTRFRWKLDRVVAERNALVAELTRGYRMLTEFARERQDGRDLITHELSLLGRQLYAAMERRPGKIDRINPGISQDLTEPALWVTLASDDAGTRWLLYRSSPQGAIDRTPVKAAGGLIELLAWIHVNGLAAPGTPVHCEALPRDHGTPQQLRILRLLARHLPRQDTTPRTLEAFQDPPAVVASLLFVDAERSAAPGARGQAIDHLYVTTWGEILVERGSGSRGALLDTLCRHLDLSPTASTPSPPVFRTFSFAPADVRMFTTQLDKLAEAIWSCGRDLGPNARYIGRLDERLYLFERREQRLRWLEIGGVPELLDVLGEPTAHFRPTRLDPAAIPGSPLPRLLERNRPGTVQMFYRVDPAGIDMWVLDDVGSLFEQHFPHASEQHFLAHQRRFFDNLVARRLLLDGAAQAALCVQVLRVTHDGRSWGVREVSLPVEAAGSYLELSLVTGSPERRQTDYTLVCGGQEFDALLLGKDVYRRVAEQVLERRRGDEGYPIYITGVQPAGLEVGAEWSVTAMLRLKRRLERCLNAAIGLSGPLGPDA